MSDRESFDHHRLHVYRLATTFFRESYRLSQPIRRDDSFLRYQFLRAALSIKANIAEGAGDIQPKEKARFYRIARRSAHESAVLLEEVEFLLLSDKGVCDQLYAMLRRIMLALGRKMEARGRSAGPRRKPTRKTTK
ncbi:MAG: four helix bundle protein [Longimicrobiales bacterium]